MADIDIATGAVYGGTGAVSGLTWCTEQNPANDTGVIDHLECYLDSSGTVKFGTWYGRSGYTYSVRGYTGSLSAGAGVTTFDAPGDFTAIDVETGDFLAIYCASGDINYDAGGGASYWTYADTIDTGETDDNGTYTVSIYGEGTAAGGGISVPVAYHNLQIQGIA